MQKSVQTPPSRTRRLQRDKDFTGGRLSSFREVFLRHGLPGLSLAVLCFAVPGLPTAFLEGLARGLANPALYGGGFVLVFLALAGYACLIDGRWSFARLGWVVYLGALSFWEEWVFRLALPHMLEGAGISVWLAAGLSALVFGGAHYFTLRWKLQWCVGAVIGSLLLSRQMQVHEDLLLISAFHWIATLLNTPRPPGQNG
ncbi:MAG: hypothetical protein AAFY10_01345 [Pseudomonadota bacterium]